MSEDDKGKRPAPQPLRDTHKILKAFEQSPIWREQQAKLAEIRKATLEDPEPETVATPEPVTEATNEATPELASEPAPSTDLVEGSAATSEPAADKESKQGEPIKRKKRPKQWAADWKLANPRRKDEAPGEYAQRMCDAMANAQDVTEPWPFKTCQRELYRKPSEADFEPDPDSVQDYPKHH
jgi:hypothetical protein